MYACGLKKTQVLFLALRRTDLAPPSPSFQSDRSLAGPSYIPVNIQDMVYPEVSAENRELRHMALGKSLAPLPAEQSLAPVVLAAGRARALDAFGDMDKYRTGQTCTFPCCKG